MTSLYSHDPSCGCPICSEAQRAREARQESAIAAIRLEAPSLASPVASAREVAETFALRFRGNANSLAMAYGGPLYLVGSVLTSPAPGDIDLRLCLERAEMLELFGKDFDSHGLEWSNAKWRLEREQLKQSRRLTRRWRGGCPAWRFDFQFQCSLYSDVDGLPIMREDKPSLRLDTVPLDYFRAGRGDP